MCKKISAFALASVMVLIVFCSCEQKESGNVSSLLTSPESSYSENETSSMASSEQKQESSEQETESQESSSEAETETSSKNDETSSEINESESSDKEESDEQETSTSSDRINVGRPQSSLEEETSSDQTSSRGQAVTLNVNPANALGVGIYHFQPEWTKNYGDTPEDRYKEFEDVIAAGYFNTVIVSAKYVTSPEFWEICQHYGVSVWMSLYSYFNSDKETIDEFMQERVDTYVSVIKAKPEWWELFCGFHHEETIWRGQSNSDYLEMTKKLYQTYGKRNFAVFATGEFTGYEGNQLQIDMDAADMKKVNPSALEFTTDMAYDSYGVDVRAGKTNGGKYTEWQNVSPNIVDGQSYYREHTKVMLQMLDHDVNVWFFPTAYTTYTWGGYRADEAYCLAHLNFFYEHLKEQEFQGGLYLYTYSQFSNEEEKGMQSHLVVENWAGEQTLRPQETEKWVNYSNRLREITSEFKNTKANQAVF